MNRRKVIRAIMAVGSVGFAGCSDANREDPERSRSSDQMSQTATSSGGPTAEGTSNAFLTSRPTISEEASSKPTSTALGTQVPRRDSWCLSYDPPRPSPPAKGFALRTYPPYPQSLTPESALTFAKQHEKALLVNSEVDDEHEVININLDIPWFRSDDIWYKRKRGEDRYVTTDDSESHTPVNSDTYLIAVWTEFVISYTEQEGTSTVTLHGDGTNTAWYKLSETAGWRKHVDLDEMPTDFPPQDPDFTNSSKFICI